MIEIKAKLNGTVFYRKDKKKWVARITINNKNRQLGSFDTKGEAENALEEYNFITNGINKDLLLYTFENVFYEIMQSKTEMYNNNHEIKKKKTCEEQYKYAFKVFEKIHKKLFVKIDFQTDIIDVIKAAKKGPESNKKMKLMICMMYKHAEERGIITRNPAKSSYYWSGIVTRKLGSVSIHRSFRQNELNKILNNKTDKPEYLVNIMKFLLYTGVRVNEFYCLKKTNVFTVENNMYIEIPAEISKTKASRIIPVHDEIVDIIASNLKKNKTNYLFETPSGIPFKDDNFRNTYFGPFMDLLQIKGALPHNTRYSFKTRMGDTDVKERYVEYFLGHTKYNDVSVLYDETINGTMKKSPDSLNKLRMEINKLNYKCE